MLNIYYLVGYHDIITYWDRSNKILIYYDMIFIMDEWRTSFKTSAIFDKNSSLRSFINGTLFKNPTRSSNRLIAEVFMICWYATLSKVHTLTFWTAIETHTKISGTIQVKDTLYYVGIILKYNKYLTVSDHLDQCHSLTSHRRGPRTVVKYGHLAEYFARSDGIDHPSALDHVEHSFLGNIQTTPCSSIIMAFKYYL